MSISPGSQFGVYTIIARLGEGGMGTVFRARDPRLDRDVALKVADAQFSERFTREAKAIAALNHTNICHLYDVGPDYLVMELVEGATLRGPLALADALPLVRQLVDGIEAAHDKGIVHRDLKPANIQVTAEGVVKILDFGLAKALAPEDAESAANAANSPTIAIDGTRLGTILGTAAYMAPEQARGKIADRRADIWAFGAVVYELLSGAPAFAGETVTDILSAVVSTEPDWTRVPPPARQLLQWCLTKDRKQRLQAIGDARFALREWEAEDDATRAARTRNDRASAARRALMTTAAGIALVAAGAAAAWLARPATPAPLGELRAEIVTPPSSEPASFALSPDGSQLAFVATVNGRSSLWIRSLTQGESRELPRTQNARLPFWSPDGRAIGFFADGQLKRVNPADGAVQPLADSAAPSGGSWHPDGWILFAPRAVGEIFRMPAAGGEATPLTTLERPQQTGHRYPQLLPGGDHFLYYASGTPDARAVYLARTDGSAARRLFDADAAAVFVWPDHLFYTRQNTLFARPFDPRTLELSGEPVAVAPLEGTGQVPLVSASASGAFVYRSGASGGRAELRWFDRAGRPAPTWATTREPVAGGVFRLSPDGQRFAIERSVDGNLDIWTADVARPVPSRWTTHPALERFPVWSSDGRSIFLASSRTNIFDIYRRPSSTDGGEELVFSSEHAKQPLDVSPDGQFLLFEELNPDTGRDLWLLSLADRTANPLVKTPSDDRIGAFSPDGHWIAYATNESGRYEVWVRSRSEPASRVRISEQGGINPQWRRDGRELFYGDLEDRVVAVSIAGGPGGGVLEPGTPTVLFAMQPNRERIGGTAQPFAVSPDGQRFLVNTRAEEATTPPISLVLNWRSPQRP